jgi:hypothetical protein
MPEFMRSVAPQTLHFTPWGLGGAISPEAWMEIARAEMDAMPLPPEVPPEVGGPWAKLQRLYCSGLFDYEAFTHVARDAHRVLEIALKMCFLEHYQRRIPVTADGRLEVRDVRSFDDVFALLGSGSRKGGHRLQGHPRFDASLNSLMVWAREERYFYGQRNRVREEVTVEIRNYLVHSEFDLVEAPPEALRTLSSLYQMILRLWGYNTPGYDLYPGPIRRSPWLLGVGVNELRYVWLPLAGMSGVPQSERHDLMWYVLLASETERLSEWTPGFATTATPVGPLWGPGSWQQMEAAVAAHESSWCDDEIEVLDRIFYVRVRGGIVEHARSADQLAGVPDAAEDRWYAVRADHPHGAVNHVARLVAGTCVQAQGWCAQCARDGIHVEGLLPAAQRATIARFILRAGDDFPPPRRAGNLTNRDAGGTLNG